MLNEDGFKHHINNVAHSTAMYQAYGFDEHSVSVENSKRVLLDAFIEQNEKTEKLEQENKRLKKFYDYFAELYGIGLEVANWHQNGDLESYDGFFDAAEQEME